MTKMVTREEAAARTRAYKDQMRRVARNDPDWGIYLDPEEGPPRSWWRRFWILCKEAFGPYRPPEA